MEPSEPKELRERVRSGERRSACMDAVHAQQLAEESKLTVGQRMVKALELGREYRALSQLVVRRG